MVTNLSIIIPAYNEAHKIGADIVAAAAFFNAEGIAGEIIVVDDGSADGTAAVASKTADGMACPVTVLPEKVHRGKGAAVRRGMLASQGKYVLFADAGSCVPYGDALTGLALIKAGSCGIAHGSRRHAGSIISRPQIWPRRMLSRLFLWILKLLYGLPRGIADSQCGFKVYDGNVARELYAQCQSDGFMFDVEIILQATAAGYRIVEFPIHWVADPDSRVSLRQSALSMLKELAAIKKRLA